MNLPFNPDGQYLNIAGRYLNIAGRTVPKYSEDVVKLPLTPSRHPTGRTFRPSVYLRRLVIRPVIQPDIN